jgi:anaerobic magnesium-protoporphyrin IX monomethyl ester cyclase
MKIAFINPPFFPKYSREQRSPAVTKSGTFYYPMWLCYAAGYSEKKGNEIRLWDATTNISADKDVLIELEDFKPKIAVISTSTPSIYSDIEFASEIKKLIKDIFILLVGVHVSALPEETLLLSNSIDAVTIGEYEKTVVEIAEYIDGKRDIKEINGLGYKDKEIITINYDKNVISGLNEIPWVSKIYNKYLDYKNYFYSGNLYPLIVLLTSRGCPCNCSFCVYPQVFTGHKVRFRSIEDVVDEMEYVEKTFKPLGEIMFEDDTLTINKERVVKFCDEIIKRRLNVKWSCNARVQLDLETMIIMKRAGCRSLLVGFESGSQVILDNMRKGSNLKHYEKFMKETRVAGLLVNAAFLVGCPGETRESMKKTLELAKKLNPDVAQFFPIMVYPGTKLYNDYKDKGYLRAKNYRDWLNEDGLHNCVVNMPGMEAKEMVEFCDYCRKKYYLRPNYIIRKGIQALISPKEGLRTIKAARTFAKHLFKGTNLR